MVYRSGITVAPLIRMPPLMAWMWISVTCSAVTVSTPAYELVVRMSIMMVNPKS